MSYNISIVNDKGEMLKAPPGKLFQIPGVSINLIASNDLEMTMTYNYSKIILDKAISFDSIRDLHGEKVVDTISFLVRTIVNLKNNPTEKYYHPVEGNARRAFIDMLSLAFEGLDGYWNIS